MKMTIFPSHRRSVVALALVLLILTGCQSVGPSTKRGAAAGAAAGAILGAIVGHQSGETGEGAALGAAVGGAIGAAKDQERTRRQEEEIELAHIRTEEAQARRAAAAAAAQQERARAVALGRSISEKEIELAKKRAAEAEAELNRLRAEIAHAEQRTEDLEAAQEREQNAANRKSRTVILSGDVHIGCLGVIRDSRGSKLVNIHQVVSSAIVHPAPTYIQWLGILAVTNDRTEYLDENREIRIDMLKPYGSNQYLRTRNFVTMQDGTDSKLWVNWICENGEKPTYPLQGG